MTQEVRLDQTLQKYLKHVEGDPMSELIKVLKCRDHRIIGV